MKSRHGLRSPEETQVVRRRVGVRDPRAERGRPWDVDGAAAGATSEGAGGVASPNGLPGVTKVAPMIWPFALPALLVATVPVPSSSPQRPTNPDADTIGAVIPAWIWAAERAWFQTRASSITPSKKPAATPVESMAVPGPKCWMLSKRGVAFAASVASSSPSRYSRQVVPS